MYFGDAYWEPVTVTRFILCQTLKVIPVEREILACCTIALQLSVWPVQVRSDFFVTSTPLAYLNDNGRCMLTTTGPRPQNHKIASLVLLVGKMVVLCKGLQKAEHPGSAVPHEQS